MNKENTKILVATFTVFTIMLFTRLVNLNPYTHTTLGLAALTLGTYALYKAIQLWRQK